MKKKANKKTIIIWMLIVLVVIGVIVGIMVSEKNIKAKLEFTKEDYQYMYDDISKSFGEGEEFHIVKVTEKFESESIIKTTGKEISFIGYFDSQDDMYIVVYGKYTYDKPIYKNGDAGNIICIAVNANYSKDAYLNGGE